MESIPFDVTETPEEMERPHAFSLEGAIPGTQMFSAFSDGLQVEGTWERADYRGVARRILAARQPGGRIRLRCTGSAFSLVRPTDFPAPGAYGWPPMTGPLAARIDGGEWRPVSGEAGREVLLAGGLPLGPHEVEVQCVGQAPNFWAVEGLRAWRSRPTVVTGHIDGGPLLVDVRAELTGPASFTSSLRDGRTGRFSLLLPMPGRYQLALTAPGWEPASVRFEAPAGAAMELPAIRMPLRAPPNAQPRQLSPDEPLVLIACAHCTPFCPLPTKNCPPFLFKGTPTGVLPPSLHCHA